MTPSDGSPIQHEAPVRPGDLLARKYRVERVIAVGGMGIVVAAHHEQLDQRVALKFVHAAQLGNAAAVERFLREARAAVRLKSEHVAKVLDVGTLDDGVPYIVMEYLEGCDLSQLSAGHTRVPIASCADYILQACDALAEAHALGIVHRDIKPQNLFLTRTMDGAPLVKVLDFGISKVASRAGNQLTQTNFAMGSPLYMAPEQMRSSRSVDARADVWALGVVLYELLTGGPPFKGETVPEVCLKVATDAPDPVTRTDVPAELMAVMMRCLEKDPARRFPNVAELATAIAPFAPAGSRTLASRARVLLSGNTDERHLSLGDFPIHVGTDPGTQPSPAMPTPAAWVHKQEAPSPRGKWMIAAAALATLAIVVGLYTARSKGAMMGAEPVRAEAQTKPVAVEAPAEKPAAVPSEPQAAASASITAPTSSTRPSSSSRSRTSPGSTRTVKATSGDDDIPALR